MNGTWVAAAGILACAAAMAGRPLMTNDAEPLERGRWQVEAAAGYVRADSHDHLDLPLTLTYGILPRVEAGVGFGGHFAECEDHRGRTAYEESVGDLTVGFKWKLLDQDEACCDQAVSGTVKFPTADDDEDMGSGKTDFDLTYILTLAVTDRISGLMNVGYTWLGGEGDVLHYGPAVTWQRNDRWQPVAELVVETPVDRGRTSAGVNVGIRYQLKEGWTLDAAAMASVAGDWPDFAVTAGITWVF